MKAARGWLRRNMKPIPRQRKKPRRGPLRCPEYVTWLHGRRCAVDQWSRHYQAKTHNLDACFGQIVGAHTRNNGLSSKGPDDSRAPLCVGHHAEYDRGREAFEAKYGVDMQREAAGHWAVFQISREAT